MQLVKTGVPMQRIATDILGELPETENGNKYILVVSDYFTKWTEAFPMPNMEAQTVAKIIVEEVVTRFGVPHYIHSDQGRQYESKLFQEMCRHLGITKTRTTPYHPQSDVHCDRLRKKVAQSMRGEDSCDASEAHEPDIIEVENVEEVEELVQESCRPKRNIRPPARFNDFVEFGSEEDLKTHLLLCVKEKSEIRCEDCGTIFKKHEYMKRHMKNIHGVETGKRSYKVIEKKADVSQDDLDQYDPGNLIDDISDNSSSAVLDTSDDSDSDEQDSERKAGYIGEVTDRSVKNIYEEDTSQKKEEKKVHTPEDQQSDPTVRKRCAPLPVSAPAKRKSRVLHTCRQC
ncbi:Hypothetical predicted protein [Mytilus galloprovincialis]|uniref:Integrase catalytic domain-containing protein n=1 Tax=Mytilus galloprovincialis TaxID=29158 RepID=A0A8B6GQC7_MYTGA|nr:Hypothetical predicted protein [Mytilus galloprovincialis]